MNPWQALRQTGDEFTPRAIALTRELFIPGALTPRAAGARVVRDVPYGPDARHRLDVFSIVGARGWPVVVFVHGGGFAGGDKGDAEAPFYNNVGAWAARSGFVGVNLTYRLAPGSQWPNGACDVAAALAWVRQHIAAHGGDPDRTVVIGQSAGAAHVAGCLAGHATPVPDVAAAVFLSGIYEPDRFHVNPMHQVYFGADASRHRAQSCVLALAATRVPCLFTISEFDPPQFHRQLAAVVEARTALTGRCPQVLWQHGHNHFSTSMQLGGPHDTLGAALAQFVRRS